MQARPMPSCAVGPSVRPSRSRVLSKRVIVSSNCFSPSGSQTILVSSMPNVMAIFRRETTNGGVGCRWGIGTNPVSGRIAGYRSIAARASNSCDGRPCSLSHRRRRISESLFITACSWTNTPKRT